MRKERRDRDYEHRPIASFLNLNDLRPEKRAGNHIMFNEEVFDFNSNQNGGHFFKISNVSKSPMLSVSVKISYKNDFQEQHYEILIIEEGQSFVIPISNFNPEDSSKWENELKVIKIEYRSLSGQKYSVKSSQDGEITVKAHKGLVFYEKIISSEGNTKTRFEKY